MAAKLPEEILFATEPKKPLIGADKPKPVPTLPNVLVAFVTNETVLATPIDVAAVIKPAT